MKKRVHIFGGGTVAHISNHFAIAAPAYGNTAEHLFQLCVSKFDAMEVHLELTKMGGHGFWDSSCGQVPMETNEDVAKRIDQLKKDMATKIIFFNCALVDYEPKGLKIGSLTKPDNEYIYEELSYRSAFGKYQKRLETNKENHLSLELGPAKKIIPQIRQGRKDIFLVGFKTTCGASEQEMFTKGLNLVKKGSCNLVLVNDTKKRLNMIITPEEAAYHVTEDRNEALEELVDMTYFRSHLTFTQSTVVDGKPEPWDSDVVPSSLRTVVDYCVNGNAYKPFNGSTVGHFAVKISDTEFLTSIRRSNFNDLNKVGLVRVTTDGPDTVIAYGAKPSVGGQSQRIVFKDHPGMDCIVHFHSPLKQTPRDEVPVRSQREYECGSHQCGKNTSEGLKKFGNLWAVYLEQHGPNIVFNRNIDPKEVIDFIKNNFDLEKKTGGYTV